VHSQIYLSGILASEPEVGTTRKGDKLLVKLLLETELVRQVRPNEFQAESTLVPLSCFGWPAEVARSLHRGDSVLVGAHLYGTEFKTDALLKDHAFFNGFANRFLWVCARRANYLPEPPSFADLGLTSHFEYLKKAALWASQVGEMERSDAASKIWHEKYRELSAEGEGKFGAATDRAEAQVLRLSMNYALSSGERLIDVGAQEAAFAMWKYCEDSARFLFDDTLTKPEAKRILAALRSKREGITNSEIPQPDL
jgi:hypothetical protein